MEEKNKRELKKIREKALREKEVQDGVYDGRMTTKVHKVKSDKNINYDDEVYEYFWDDDEEFEEEEEEEEFEPSPWRTKK